LVLDISIILCCKLISKTRFLDWTKLPIFIAEKLFKSIDLNDDSFISNDEFINSLSLLYLGNFEETAKVIFNLYDFDRDGRIHLEDVKTILAFLPLKGDKTKIVYKYQLESLAELNDILKKTFESHQTLSFEEFLESIKRYSDIYLQLLCFLYQRCQIHQKDLKTVVKVSKLNSDKELKGYLRKNNGSDHYKSAQDILNTSNVLLNSPSDKSIFFPVEDFLSSNHIKAKKRISSFSNLKLINSFNNILADEKKEKENNQKESIIDEVDNSKIKPKNYDSFSESITAELSGLKGVRKIPPKRKKLLNAGDNICNGSDNIDKNYHNFEEKKPTKKTSSFTPTKTKSNKRLVEETNTKLNEIDKLNYNSSSTDSDTQIIFFPDENENDQFPGFNIDINNQNLDKSVIKKTIDFLNKKIIFEGSILIYKTTEELKLTIWLVLIDQNIYYFTDESKSSFTGFHHLANCFIKENGKEIIQGETYYTFSIIFPNKTRAYHTKDRENAKQWTQKLRATIGYQNLFDNYEIIDELGKGQFGEVKLGVDTKTNEKIAVKIINKKKMKEKEIELVQREIDIMKLSKHPNIITFIDHFENSEYIFIVMEYLRYGTLQEYIKKTKNISEEICSNIIFQIAIALKYLHDFGIIHRDIKPDNIMISTNYNKEKDFKIKITDFGLSKILSPLETTTEGYGTLIFVAPEILTRSPYNRSIDIWSLGIVTYFLTSHMYPFSNQKNLIEKIINEKLKFPKEHWDKKSPELIDFIEKCLEKDQNKRVTIDKLLSHIWISNCGK